MSSMTTTTASTLRAVLAYCDPNNTPKIAYDRDDLAIPLIEKIKSHLGERDGSQTVYISFGKEEAELERQFHHICDNISSIFELMAQCTKQ